MVQSRSAEGASFGAVSLHERFVLAALADGGPAFAHHLLVLTLVVLHATPVARRGAVDVHEAGVPDALALPSPAGAGGARVHAAQGLGVRHCDHEHADERGECDPGSSHFFGFLFRVTLQTLFK